MADATEGAARDGLIAAPWTHEQVEALNRWQANDWVHPYTCGNRGEPGHKEYAEAHGQHDHGILVATPAGWVCPACDYTQDTAWAGMLHVEAFDFTAALQPDTPEEVR
jgi:hypothetical protein